MSHVSRINITAVFFAGIIMVATLTQTIMAQPQITVTKSAASVGKYQAIELSILCASPSYTNKWGDVSVACTLAAPSTAIISIGGFYYSGNTWKIRFAPWETGTYAYRIKFTDKNGSASNTGSFTCIASNEPGFLRKHPDSPYRLITEADGKLFNVLGWGPYIGNESPSGNHWPLDGGLKTDPGYVYPGYSLDRYLTAMADTGKMNMLRISINNCCWNMWQTIAPGGNTYLEVESRWTDTLCQAALNHKVRLYLDIFGWQPAFKDQWSDAASMNAVKRYVKYMVDRYGALVDIWEIANETTVPAEWASIVARYIKSVDPYQHMVSVNWEQPNNLDIDIVSPHWYEKEGELYSDTRARDEIRRHKGVRKPIIYGEQGNSVQNWDSLSDLRARIRSWTAFFNEGHFVFWEQNGSKDYQAPYAANLYIGHDLRSFLNVLQAFAAGVEPDIQMDSSFTVSSQTIVRGYGLRSADSYYLYLRNGSSISATTNGVSVSLSTPKAGKATWISTQTGTVLKTEDYQAGSISLTAPSFVTDVALQCKGSTASTGSILIGDDHAGRFSQNKTMLGFGSRIFPEPGAAHAKLYDIRGKLIASRSVGSNGILQLDMKETGRQAIVVKTDR